ncbi:cytochrome c oxidase assembly protein subunit 15 [Singulisphaera sp. GP187]|uniref:COX15/CtaA family protein n=1 Tax=Singulisphaera sp. GP187 TaxID=1882752 RepID=UPI000926F07B|nr:COX15/CtaA family protein [Singulisphaera sp. GP187]SIO21891.1 cytochrome c oxidase assembly protein subunit 15 [Singulisphaera sp. GP187]
MANDRLNPIRSASAPAYKPGPHWVAVVAAVFTWPLIFVGGSVTTYRVGMAVPDWPTTFGINMFLYDFWNAPFGVRVEHTHRLYGAAVGFTTLILAIWFLAAEPRRSMKWLGVLALVTVIGQGVLGGTRVTQNSTVLAAVHGVTAQAFFALMVSLCVLTGRDWITSTTPTVDSSHLRRRSAVTLFLVAAQIAVGAWLRHFPWMASASLLTHALLGFAVWGHAAMLAWRVERNRGALPELVPSARAMALVVMLQVVLGVASWWMLRPFDGIPRTVTILQAMVRTGHQANGALLLATSVVLTFRAYRHLTPAHKAPGWSSQSAPGLEVVA